MRVLFRGPSRLCSVRASAYKSRFWISGTNTNMWFAIPCACSFDHSSYHRTQFWHNRMNGGARDCVKQDGAANPSDAQNSSFQSLLAILISYQQQLFYHVCKPKIVLEHFGHAVLCELRNCIQLLKLWSLGRPRALNFRPGPFSLYPS